MKKIELEIPDGKKAEWVDGVLTLVDVQKPKDVTKRIKTLDDAIKELGEENELVRQFHQISDDFDETDGDRDLIAYLKLRIIVAALNEGWQPQFTENEYKYFPYFRLYTKAEIDKMDDGHKKKLWVWGGYSYYGASSGFGDSYSYGVGSASYSAGSARLALKSEELAVYCGKQFIDIWADYCLYQRKDEKDS